MKILIIHPFFTSDEARGSEVIAQETYKILKERGHEVFYFATDKKPFLEDTPFSKYFPHYYKHFVCSYYWNIDAQRNLKNMLKKIKPDIVHMHGTHILTYSIFKPLLEQKIPIVMTIHDSGIICPVRLGWNENKKLICKKCKGYNNLPCIINNCILTKKRISSFNVAFINFLENLSGYNKKIKKFIIPSKALANYVNSRDIPKKKMKIIPNFLNNKFINKSFNESRKDYFLFVGTLADYKGVDVLLDAIKLLPDEIPFKIIGSGFQEEKYKQVVKENNLSNIEFLGNIDRKNIIKYYLNCISLIVPSNCFEIFGMINIEAAACGKPVIASNIGGIPEIVEHNKTGLLFEPANVEQLKECILKYWNNPELVAEHGKNGYNKATTQYTEEKYYESLIKVYEEVLNEK